MPTGKLKTPCTTFVPRGRGVKAGYMLDHLSLSSQVHAMVH
jgi:hypothetical protein